MISQKFFINTDGSIKNDRLLKKRILGLASYFRSAQEKLMPAFNKETDYKVVKIPMSSYQFAKYEEARQGERKQETSNARKRKKAGVGGVYEDAVSTYRIFSRLFCNFVFPPELKRPLPKESETLEEAIKQGDEDDVDGASVKDKLENVDGRYDLDDEKKLEAKEEEVKDESYDERIQSALRELQENGEVYLSKENPDGLEKLSPKFLNVLENIEDPDHTGSHLIYSQFRTMEGVGILKLILEANGFTQFKIRKGSSGWKIAIPEEDKGKPTFALYTGTEDAEEKEIIRNIFNGDWGFVPSGIAEELEGIAGENKNKYGDIIKVFMITSSGAEGISLKNVRFVHLIEPYWHPVRTEQVIGRARRICSHQDLPEVERNVKVFMYLMTFTEEQRTGDASIELRRKDKGKRPVMIDGKPEFIPLTSDEALYEISQIKEDVNKQLLNAIKSSSIDCRLHALSGSKEGYKCFTFGEITSTKSLSYVPNYQEDQKDKISDMNMKKLNWVGREMKLGGKKYIIRLGDDKKTRTNQVYDYDSYKLAMEDKTGETSPIFVGYLVVTSDKKAKIVKELS